jgi:hypothetical protein
MTYLGDDFFSFEILCYWCMWHFKEKIEFFIEKWRNYETNICIYQVTHILHKDEAYRKKDWELKRMPLQLQFMLEKHFWIFMYFKLFKWYINVMCLVADWDYIFIFIYGRSLYLNLKFWKTMDIDFYLRKNDV